MSSVPLANQPRDGSTVLKGGHQLAIVNVQDLRRRAKDLGRRVNLSGASLCQGAARHGPVPNVTVGHGNQLHMVPELCPFGTTSTRTVFRVIGVRAKNDNT